MTLSSVELFEANQIKIEVHLLLNPEKSFAVRYRYGRSKLLDTPFGRFLLRDLYFVDFCGSFFVLVPGILIHSQGRVCLGYVARFRAEFRVPCSTWSCLLEMQTAQDWTHALLRVKS